MENLDMFDLTKEICGTGFSVGWLQNVLQKVFWTQSAIADCKSSQIGIGNGFLSSIIKIEITWSEANCSNEQIPSNFVLKAPSVEAYRNMDKQVELSGETASQVAETSREFADECGEDMLIMAHNTEVQFYHLMEGMEPDVQQKLPRCYHSSAMEKGVPQSGVLILEDLSVNGIVRTVVQGLPLNAIIQVVEYMAVLHAWCLKSNKESAWRSTLNMNFSKLIKQTSSAHCLKMNEATVQMVLAEFPGVFDDVIARCRQAGVLFGLDKRRLNVNADLGMTDVLVHGDLWTANLMFEKETEDVLFKIIDWQMCHPGCFMEDLVRLLQSSCKAELRRANSSWLLRHYHHSLTKHLGHPPPFTTNQLEIAFKKCFEAQAFMVFFMLPTTAKQTGVLGDDPASAREEILQRTKALLEDCLTIKNDF